MFALQFCTGRCLDVPFWGVSVQCHITIGFCKIEITAVVRPIWQVSRSTAILGDYLADVFCHLLQMVTLKMLPGDKTSGVPNPVEKEQTI